MLHVSGGHWLGLPTVPVRPARNGLYLIEHTVLYVKILPYINKILRKNREISWETKLLDSALVDQLQAVARLPRTANAISFIMNYIC